MTPSTKLPKWAQSLDKPAVERLLSRRDVMQSMTAAVVLAAAEAFHPPEVMAAIRARFGMPPSHSAPPSRQQALLTPAHLTFEGFYRFPNTGFGSTALVDSVKPSLAARANGNFLMWGGDAANFPLYEFAVPVTAPNPNLAAAPTCTLVRNWGNVRAGHEGETTNNAAGLWVDANGVVWWLDRSAYTQNNKPTVACTVLNDGAGTFQSYGPWRSSAGGYRANSALMAIPPWFQSHVGGKTVSGVSSSVSGAFHSLGPSLTPMDLSFDPTQTPADPVTGSQATVDTDVVVWHDHAHAQATDAIYKICGAIGVPGDVYSCAAGAVLSIGAQVWATANPGIGEHDSMHGGVWIDWADRYGVIYFGQLVTTPLGYTAPFDVDGIVHRGYADLSGNPGGNTCCHGQQDYTWGSTGPWQHHRERYFWFYNPDRFIPLAQGLDPVWSLAAADSRAALREYVTTLGYANGSNGRGFGYGAVADESTRRIYILFHNYDNTQSPFSRRRCLMVFGVN